MRNRILIVLGVTLVVGLVLYFAGFRMGRGDLHISAAAEPLICIGGVAEGEFCSSSTVFPITNSLVMTLLIDVILIGLALAVGGSLKLVPRGLQNAMEAVVEGFYNFARGVDRANVAKFFPLPMTILLFFLVANLLALVPGVGSIGVCRPYGEEHSAMASVGLAINKAEGEEAKDTTAFSNWPGACSQLLVPALRAPAADLNVTFAFALVAVFMVEFFGFQALGLGYLSKFFVNPFKEGAIATFVGLIELISEIMRILSFAFRIFGNIFGGEVILVVMSFLFGYLLPLPFYGFEVFVALMQALIFAILTLIFSSLAVQAHGGHDDHGHEEGKAAAAH
jgi:F-type H+-transporting ATPase subunit a